MAKPKLPPNMVRAPMFDSPLKKTSGTSISVAETPTEFPEAKIVKPEPKEVPVAQISRKMRTAPAAPKQATRPVTSRAGQGGSSSSELEARFTVRLPKDIHAKLEKEALRRRMKGDKTSVGAMTRDILCEWVTAL